MSELYKVKLVAIAKDEAAYLPEWIFHHLYFGFDAIDIYVNNTTDNTYDLADELSGFKNVSFLNGDPYFYGEGHPQQKIYVEAFEKAKKSGFSHIIFLDIDEFWTAHNMTSSIKECISEIGANIISFEWINKFEDSEFSFAIDKKIIGEHHRLVKSLTDLSLEYEKLDIHNVTSKASSNVLANGEKAIFSKGNQQLASIGDVKPYFIVHRMYRSQMEYVSLLGRGRPNAKCTFKDNRNGFCYLEYKLEEINVLDCGYEVYELRRKEFLNECISFDLNEKSKKFILDRYEDVLKRIESATIDDFDVLRKILRNLKSRRVNDAFSLYLSNICSYLAHDVTDAVRDAAMSFEKKNIHKAMKLMKIAHCFRPKGIMISEKVKKYELEIEKKGC
ncbi:MAG: glycosyltransferase family 2 protein [Marinomonas sp.]